MSIVFKKNTAFFIKKVKMLYKIKGFRVIADRNSVSYEKK